MEPRGAALSDSIMALPRYLIAGATEKKAAAGKRGGVGFLPRNHERRAAAVGVFKE
jgi:hypothetical protein